MKKKIKVSLMLFSGALVFLGALVGSAVSAKSDETHSASSALYSMTTLSDSETAIYSDLPERDVDALSMRIGTTSEERVELASTQAVAESDPSPTPTSTPHVLTDISPKTIKGTYEYNNEDKYQYSEEEKAYIARVVYAEARGEMFEGQVAVAAVVINRFESGQFGKSVKKVVFAPYQFAVSKKHNDQALLAVQAAIDGEGDFPGDMYYFQASKSKRWYDFEYYVRIGGHSFYCAAS